MSYLSANCICMRIKVRVK